MEGIIEVMTCLREAVRFLRLPEQRPLLCLLIGLWIFQVVNEFYDGKMITKQILHGGDDAIRYAELIWSLADRIIVGLIPLLARRVGSLGKISSSPRLWTGS